MPKTNRRWWLEKLEANARRDRQTNEELRGLGWDIVRVWGHEPVSDAADRIEAVYSARLKQLQSALKSGEEALGESAVSTGWDHERRVDP